jgi:hypothetical protein
VTAAHDPHAGRVAARYGSAMNRVTTPIEEAKKRLVALRAFRRVDAVLSGKPETGTVTLTFEVEE